MTWHHVVIIVAAIAALVYCGSQSTCHDLVPSLKDVVMVAVSGVLGNALGGNKLRGGRTGDSPGAESGVRGKTPPRGSYPTG